ncbi:MAG: hypothetical protein U0359_14415 [Byssovorax sp.]
MRDANEAQKRRKMGAPEVASGAVAVADLKGAAVDDDAVFSALLVQIADQSKPPALRSEIISTIQAQSFASPKFGAVRPRWLAALRGLAGDPDEGVRYQALSLLANENDGFVQDLLLKGLRDPSKAALPPESALLLLGSDVHAEVFPIARKLAESAPNDAVRAAALQVLSADAESEALFSKILKDKQEAPEIRRLAITALSKISPLALRKSASELAMASDEHADVVATSLTALAIHETAVPADLEERARKLAAEGTPEVKAAASQLLRKIAPE